MPNYFVSYDLNGQQPTHAQMDKHIEKLGRCAFRVLETVWYIHSASNKHAIYTHVSSILSGNDRLLVIDAQDCEWSNLLVADERLQKCWNS